MTSGDKPEVGAGGARLSEAADFIDAGGKCGRGLNADTKDAHELPAGLGSVGELTQCPIHFRDLLHQPSSHGKQRGDARVRYPKRALRTPDSDTTARSIRVMTPAPCG